MLIRIKKEYIRKEHYISKLQAIFDKNAPACLRCYDAVVQFLQTGHTRRSVLEIRQVTLRL